MTILISKQVWRRNPEPIGKQLGNRLTTTERENVRLAVIYICGRYRNDSERVEALHMEAGAIKKAKSRHRAQTYRLACHVARAAGVPVEKILTGMWPGDRCPHCGGTGKASQVVELIGRPTSNKSATTGALKKEMSR